MACCTKCKDNINEEDIISCNGFCKGAFHHLCVGINIGVFRKMTKDNRLIWKCSECRNLKKQNEAPVNSNKNKETRPTVYTGGELNINNLDDLYFRLKQDMDNNEHVRNTEMSCIKELICGIKGENLEFKKEIERLNSQVNEILVENKELKTENNQLKEKILSLNDEVDELAQYSRQNNVEISGLPEEKNENLNEIVIKLAETIECDLHSDDVLAVHRLGGFKGNEGIRNIILQFKNKKIKQTWIKKAKLKQLNSENISGNLKQSRIFINDHLTKKNKHLFYQARVLKREKEFKFLWINECRILIRKDENAKIIRIRNQSDIDRLNVQ